VTIVEQEDVVCAEVGSLLLCVYLSHECWLIVCAFAWRACVAWRAFCVCKRASVERVCGHMCMCDMCVWAHVYV